MTKTFLALAATILITAPAFAGTEVSCPDLAEARQLGDCPSEADLKRLFRSTCGGEQAPDAKEPELCDTFAEFKRQKNYALWESADGEFMGYVTCNRPAAETKAAKAVGIGLARRGKMSKVTCVYDGDVRLSLRTREACAIPGVEIGKRGPQPTCGPDPASCKVVCE